MNIAFAGFRHGHIYSLYNLAMNDPEVNITAAWESDPQAKLEAQNSHGITFTHDDYDAMLSEADIDAVAVGDYYGRRGELIIKALKAGKHVIADKPLCTSLDELDEIERLAKEKNLQVSCMLSLRYTANASAVRDIVKSGRLGNVNSIYFGGQHPLMYGSRPMWYFEDGKHGGVINDIAIHGIDLISYTLGLKLGKINAVREWNAYAKEAKDFKDSAQFMIELDNGAGVIADVSYAAPTSFSYSLPTYWMFIIWGDGGMIKFNSGSDGVEAYFEGEKEMQLIKGTAPENDYLKNFKSEINGSGILELDTEAVIRSSRDTLMIQSRS